LKRSLEVYVDGACSGNPGPAAIGALIMEGQRNLKNISQTIGDATNNIAEYTALIFALQEVLLLKADQVKVYTDSELMYQQVTGAYKVKNDHLKLLHAQVQHLIQGFNSFEIKYIPREQNSEADKLATQALKKKQIKMVAPARQRMLTGGEESPSSTG